MKLSPAATLYHGDCRTLLRSLPDNSIDSVVTDPPYHLLSTVKRFANSPRTESTMPKAEAYARHSRGFMGQKWDGGDIAFQPEVWSQVLRVLKPGAHLLAMGGTRTYHRLACAIELAGFDVRDMLQWLYGTGFPKSHNMDGGRGTALKPACEPICLARKPLSEPTIAANVQRWGTGMLNIDGCRIEGAKGVPASPRRAAQGTAFGDLSKDPGTGSGWDKTVGRWPPNVVHDGSAEVVEAFPQSAGQLATARPDGTPKTNNIYGKMKHQGASAPRGDTGSAARFFYCAKAGKADRAGSKHPTVKPVALMAWLCRLITPPRGLVLDPFAGSGTTGLAAVQEGFRVILCEREDEYVADITHRFTALTL